MPGAPSNPEKRYSRKRDSVPAAQQMLGSVMGVQAPPRTLALRICDNLRLPACRLGNSPASGPAPLASVAVRLGYAVIS